MIWKLALALVEIARILARRVAASDAEQSAAAKIFLKQMERADEAIAKAQAARDRVRGADGRLVRNPDPNSRD